MPNPPRVPWINWSGSQEFSPDAIVRPHSLEELTAVVRDVSARSGRLKAVATGLSFSDILRTDDTLVEVVGLLGEAKTGALLPLEDELWKQPRPSTPLVRVACGARIRALNQALAEAGLGFSNLGGYDGQTLIGAISTSTHGSGLTLPPLSDGVRSLDLLSTGGALYRLEPSAGLTDPDKFARRYGTTRALLQSDRLFYPSLVSLGCFGIITAVTMAVSPAYRLLERRRLRLWSEVARELESRAPLHQFRNYEVTLNPYPRRDGDYDCLVTERNVASPELPTQPLPPDRQSAESLTFLASSQREVLKLMANQPRLIPTLLRTGMEALVNGRRDHIDASHLVYNVGKINTAQVIFGEYFYPLKNNAFIHAIGRLLDLVRFNAQHGIYQPTPLSLRFVAGSKAPLSMVFDEPHCSVEIALFTDMPHAIDALLSYERLCLELGGRPHWGQMHELTGAPGWLRKAYRHLDDFLVAYDYFNDRGLFNNHFTDRLGLSMPQRGSL